MKASKTLFNWNCILLWHFL